MHARSHAHAHTHTRTLSLSFFATFFVQEYETMVETMMWHGNYQQLLDHVAIAELKQCNAVLGTALSIQVSWGFHLGFLGRVWCYTRIQR